MIELLKSFGELRAFNLVKDPATGQSKVCLEKKEDQQSIHVLSCRDLHSVSMKILASPILLVRD